ncbi:hypothetical protein YC2023_013802 [Brassica napus]
MVAATKTVTEIEVPGETLKSPLQYRPGNLIGEVLTKRPVTETERDRGGSKLTRAASAAGEPSEVNLTQIHPTV